MGLVPHQPQTEAICVVAAALPCAVEFRDRSRNLTITVGCPLWRLIDLLTRTIFIYRACMQLGIDPYKDVEACRASAEASKIAVSWTNISEIISFLPSILIIPVTGALIDRVGRKPFLFGFTLTALFYNVSLMLIAGGAPIFLAYLADLVLAICGYEAKEVASNSYLSDVSDSVTRSRDFAFVDGILIISSLSAPFIGGLLESYVDALGLSFRNGAEKKMSPMGVMLPLLVGLALLFISLVWIIIGLPESLKIRRSETKKESAGSSTKATDAVDAPSPDANNANAPTSEPTPAVSVWQVLASPWIDALSALTLLRDPTISRLVGYRILASFYSGIYSPIRFYISLRFGWGDKELGTYYLWGALNRMLQLSVVLPALLAWFESGWRVPAWWTKAGRAARRVWVRMAGYNALDDEVVMDDEEPRKERTVYERTRFELNLIITGVIFFGLGFVIFAFLTEGWQVYLFISLESFAIYSGPVFYSVLSKSGRSEVQGRMMGAVSLAQALAGRTDTLTVNIFPGFLFLVAAPLTAVAFALLWSVDPRGLAERIEEVVAANKAEEEEADNAGRDRVDVEGGRIAEPARQRHPSSSSTSSDSTATETM
ncbi:hypothetical protein HDU96_002199 [Phlyctochytrium bullatum]|nr:hypothetical protein HDU96_002199 [Phlyctochytrium bullatum]